MNNKEELLSRFIDDLSAEKKPELNNENELDEDMESLLETVRAVKRVKNKKIQNNVRKGKFHKLSKIFGVAVAATLIFAISLGVLNPGAGNKDNIVSAVMKAYEDLDSYSGLWEIRSYTDGDLDDFVQNIEIQYKNKAMYKAVHKHNGEIVSTKYSDGNRLVIEDLHGVTVDNLFPEKELWRYHIGVPVWQLQEAIEVRELGTETILDREVKVIEYRFDESEEFNKMYIDTKTSLPLRKVINTSNSSLVTEFKELVINPKINESVFAYTEIEEVEHQNRQITVDVVFEMFPEMKELVGFIPEEFELVKVGQLEDAHLYNYVLRFAGAWEKDYLDIYIIGEKINFSYFGSSRVGSLRGGFLELNNEAINVMDLYIGESAIANFSSEDLSLFMVTNKDIGLLEEIMVKYTNQEFQEMSRKELHEKGVSPVFLKQGH